MLNKLIVWLVIRALRSKRLTGDERVKITNELLKNIGALPLRKTITFDAQGTIHINGKKLDPEQGIAFREGCMALKDSYARAILREQLRYLAIEQGVHQAINNDQVMFAKAALWYMGEEDKLINTIV